MTLYVRGTNVAIAGAKVLLEGIQKVESLTDDGYPILGEVIILDDTPEMEMRRSNVMYSTLEGDTYYDTQIEDRREDGTIIQLNVMTHDRPVTEESQAAWRDAVVRRQTLVGYDEWVMAISTAEYLRYHGLYLRNRDHNIKSDLVGDYQLTLWYDFNLAEVPNIWIVVSNNIHELEDRAIQIIKNKNLE